MSSITVEILAKKSGLSTSDLLKKISEAGLPMSEGSHTLSPEQQKQVLEHIRSTKKKIDLKLKKPLSLKKKTNTITPTLSTSQHNRNLDRQTVPSNDKPGNAAEKSKKTPRQTTKAKAEQQSEVIKPLSVEEVLACSGKHFHPQRHFDQMVVREATWS